MKNIFLSASIPLENRHQKYFETADVIAIRDAVISLASILLLKNRIIWGGHPSITPLIYYVVEKTIENKVSFKGESLQNPNNLKEKVETIVRKEIQKHVKLYQTLFFKNLFPPDNNKFENIVFTEDTGEIQSSISLMRKKMLTENKYVAGVFIGGMEGIEEEYKLFKEFHPKAVVLPLASTGGATKILYNEVVPESEKNDRFESDYGYMSLFQKYLIEKI